MKSIILHTAATDNSGARRGAGEVVEVGTGKDAIAADAAKDLLARGLCADAAPAKKPDAEA